MSFEFSSVQPEQKIKILKKIVPAVKTALPIAQKVLPVAATVIPVLRPAATIVNAIRI